MFSLWFKGGGAYYLIAKPSFFQGLLHICLSDFLGHCLNLRCFSGAQKSQKSDSRGDRGGSLIDFLQKPNDFLVFLGANYGGFIFIFHK